MLVDLLHFNILQFWCKVVRRYIAHAPASLWRQSCVLRWSEMSALNPDFGRIEKHLEVRVKPARVQRMNEEGMGVKEWRTPYCMLELS